MMLIMTRKKAQTKKGKNNNSLRIIGGEWRSRKLPFVSVPGLRPTPDRIRETLFNWLQGKVHGANCLDMFAGSGALGFEALSRGAADVIFVEKNSACAAQLKENLSLLNSQAHVVQGDGLSFLKLVEKPVQAFDLIFLDPPYRQGLISKSLSYLFDENLIDKNSFIYLEHEAEAQFEWNDFGLEIIKKLKQDKFIAFF